MDEEKLLGDFILAITILTILFGFMIVVDDATATADFEPTAPVCHDQYQLTAKAVLGCDDG